MSDRDTLAARAHALIDRCAGGERDDAARDALLRDLLAFQIERIDPWKRLVAARGVDPRTAPLDAIPAMPTDVYRFARLAVHAAREDARVFRTSGTTQAHRGEHALRDLSLYDRAARAAARHALFPDVDRMRLVVLAPSEGEAPSSSLSYMLARFGEWFGSHVGHAFVAGAMDVAALEEAVEAAALAREPVALLGTSFAFVHADDALGDRRFALPHGSRIMQTGGFKGRSRTVDPIAMRAMLGARYGVDERFVVAEYGMTELSSQMYETSLRDALDGRARAARALWIPGWMRVVAVDPERLAPVAPGEVGILRIDDVANVDTPCAIQTADLGSIADDGTLVLLGRAEGATPRGCSLALDEALGAR